MEVSDQYDDRAASPASEVTGDVLSTHALRSDLVGVLEEIANQTVLATKAAEVAVGVVNGPGVSMTVWKARRDGLQRTDRFTVVLNSSEPVAQAVRNQLPVAEFEEDSNGRSGTDVIVPMVANQQAVGVIAVSGSEHDADSVRRQASNIASRAALAVEYVRFRRNSRKALEETVTVLAAVIEGRDAYTESHCLHLAEMSLALGMRMGLEQYRLDRLNFGGLLHDIGKIAVPDAILSKPGALTDREFDQMKTHASIGEEILERIGSLEEVAPVVGQHHERLDGSGYPRGLKGEAILVEARILAVVDTFDAMTTTRPYRAALPWSQAIDEISSGAGTLFDPEVVDIFLRYMTGEEAQWQRHNPS